MLKAMAARVTVAEARARTMVGIMSRMGSLMTAKGCSTWARTADLRELALAIQGGMGSPAGFLRWIPG